MEPGEESSFRPLRFNRDLKFEPIIHHIGSGEFQGGKTSKMSGEMSGEILTLIKQNASIIIPELAKQTGVTERTIERKIQKLQQDGLLKRLGPNKGGRWEVIENKKEKQITSKLSGVKK
jgi:predicted HTH transcriptional regulator